MLGQKIAKMNMEKEHQHKKSYMYDENEEVAKSMSLKGKEEYW